MFKKGQIPWNKNKTILIDNRIRPSFGMKGKHQSIKSKLLISKSAKSNGIGLWMKGRPSNYKDKIMSTESKQKISKANKIKFVQMKQRKNIVLLK